MSAPLLVRYFHPEFGPRFGLRLGDNVHDVSRHLPSLSAWLRGSVGRVEAAIEELETAAQHSLLTFPAALFETAPTPARPHWLAPVDTQDVWAAGVTYERSREARQEEAVDGGDIYARVYRASRPELFFKAQGKWVVGLHDAVGIRADAAWSVPEPELAVVANPAMEVVGFAVGNDMSSRDIEGENPLYLPQAKVYSASCAIGPGIALQAADAWPEAAIRITIYRAEQAAFQGETHTARLKRTVGELLGYLGRSNTFPDGVALLTGTGVVPPAEFTLAVGDVVHISIDGIGTLVNPVKVV
jgi:2-dehydro-3-deoxy-D-arabinonate dehydratase